MIIVQRDLTQAPYRLYLKMEIELNGRIIIRTPDWYVPPALTLEPGIPTVISGTELSRFLEPQNMDFTGYSRDAYIRSKVLPEGAYTITFTAYDWTRRDVALSNGGSFFCYLAKTDPPMLNLPFNNSLVAISSPQYINFHWLSHSTSPNSAQSIRYRFELFEMRANGSYPSEIVQNSRPLFTSETDRTDLTYSISEPLLEKGLRYAWRVKAFDTQNRDYIRNDGYSEVFCFLYGDAGSVISFDEIENFNAQAVSSREVKLTWDAAAGYDRYKVFYRKKGDNNRWYESETVQNKTEIKGLSPEVVYECRVQGKRSNIWGNFSLTDTVMLPSLPKLNCGSAFQPLAVSNREPLQELMKMQQFDAGGFTVTSIDPFAVTIRPGRFSGKGFVQVPLFGHKKIRCEFSDIFINTDYQMVEGSVRLLCDKTKGGDNAIWDIDEVFEGGSDNGTVAEGTEEVSVLLPEVVITKPEMVILDTSRKEILIITEAFDTIHVNISDQLKENTVTITLKDSEGNLYFINTKTNTTISIGKAPSCGGQQQVAALPSIIDSHKGTVIFEPVTGETRYAFDKRNADYARSNMFNEEYQTMKMDNGTLYDIPFKLIPAGETDIVLAKAEIKDKTINPDSIIFSSGTGTRFSARPTGIKGQYLLSLPSGKDNDGIDVYATYIDSKGRSIVLGKLIIISYYMKHPKVILVPVSDNGTEIDPVVIKKELDKIYLPVAVDWRVSMDKSKFQSSADNLDVTGSNLFSQYTDGMKNLNTAFLAHKKEEFDPSAIYLFLLQQSDDKNTTGDMPRSRQFGYIFTKTAAAGGDKALYRTIAHEIAHGAFHLNHTFDSQYQVARGTTENLLDYTAGTDLVKHQWDAIHHPGLVIGMFERDEEGMSKIPITRFIDYIDLGIDFSVFKCDITDKLTFITPAGYPIVLPKYFKFCFSGITTKNELDNAIAPGVLTAFKDEKNQIYVSCYIKENSAWKFVGYKKKEFIESGTFKYSENEIKQLPNPCKIVIGVEIESDCQVKTGLINFIGDFKNKDLTFPQIISSNFDYNNYQPSFTSSYNIITCLLPSKISSLTEATCSELFSSEVWVKYNVYGDGGVLLKYNIDGNTYYVYANIDQEGKSYYFTFDNELNKWRNYVPPRIEGILNSVKFLINPKVLGKAAKDGGHESLDIMGLIPVLGEGFDALNGLWYLFEGEKGQSILCFASTLPIAGWATTGGKWIWKGAKKFGKAVAGSGGALEFVELTDEAVETITKKINDLNFPDEKLNNLASDLKANPELMQRLAEKPELIESWKILENNPILRKKIANLEIIDRWIKYGVEQEKLADAIAKSGSKQNLIDELGTAISKLHVQVLIKDYDNIPGVIKGRYISNGSILTDKMECPLKWSSSFDLPETEIGNFTGFIEPLELTSGDKIYRISHANGSGGTYWTRTKPEKLDDVIGGTSVQPEWNNFEYIHEYTVPNGIIIKTWKGKTSCQAVSKVSSNYHLPGGNEQLFINNITKQDPNFEKIVKSTKVEW